MSHPAVLVMIPGAARHADLRSRPAFRLLDETSAQLRVTDLGITRGDGVFETVGVFDGRAVNLEPHLQRLQRSAQMLELPELDLEVIAQAFEAAVQAHLPVPELAVRIIATRGVEGQDAPTVWIHARTASTEYAAGRAGLRVATLDRGLATTAPKTSPWLLAGAKSISYAVNMAAGREAQRRGADEALFVSSDGYALEGPTSTLLVRFGDRYVTTPAEAGVLAGTSLTSVFAHLRAAGATCEEELLAPEQVVGSDGAWLLSSMRLAAPITHLNDAPLPVDRELSRELCKVTSGKL